MGTLAKRGIIQGRSVPIVEGAAGLGGFDKSILESVGYAELAEKIISDADLSVDEIEFLLVNVPLSVLIKLVSLVPASKDLHVSPVISLPLDIWMEMGGNDFLQKRIESTLNRLSYRELKVILRFRDFFDLCANWSEVLQAIKDIKENVTFIGPSVDLVSSWLIKHENYDEREFRAGRLVNILSEFKKLEINILEPTAYRDSMSLLKSLGLQSSLHTRFERLGTPTLFARELFQINRSAAQDGGWISWKVGGELVPPNQSAYDMFVMRSLAVAALVLKNVKCKGLYGVYPSLRTLPMLRYVGLSGEVYGACNAETAQELSLYRYEDLTQAIYSDDLESLA